MSDLTQPPDDTSDLDRYEIESADAEANFKANLEGLLLVAQLDRDIELQEKCEDVLENMIFSEHYDEILSLLGYNQEDD